MDGGRCRRPDERGASRAFAPKILRRIERSLKRGPQALGYETSLWTSARVAHLIEHECGVQYVPSQAWRILHIPGQLLVVWDGLRSHRGRLVWDFVHEQGGRIWLEFLPAYAPELQLETYAHRKPNSLSCRRRHSC